MLNEGRIQPQALRRSQLSLRLRERLGTRLDFHLPLQLPTYLKNAQDDSLGLFLEKFSLPQSKRILVHLARLIHAIKVLGSSYPTILSEISIIRPNIFLFLQFYNYQIGY
jgi:hypothetical protein